jgi:hypothetical protein
MHFQRQFFRGDRTIPIVGEVHQQSNGRWHGVFRFSLQDAPAIRPGTAQITLDAGNQWDIMVASASINVSSDQGESPVRVLQGLPERAG